ncbi:MAG: ABC transporter permease [Spirochaetota bacterium]
MIKTREMAVAGMIREMSVLLVVFLLYGIVCLIQPRFFSYNALINISLYLPVLLLLALGEMMEVISQNIDVSLGSILAFSAYIVGLIFKEDKTFPLPLAFLIAISYGAFLGLINGFIVTRFKLPSVIVTLGTMNLFRGMIFILGGKQIDNSFIPRTLIRLSQRNVSIVGIPYTVLIAIGVAVLVALFLNRTRKGREIYATGCNPVAAKLRGISVDRIQFLVFVLAGALSGLAGMVFMSRIGYLDPGAAGRGMEFVAVAAVVIGGTSMGGGVGKTLGTVFGCLLLGVINNAIPIIGISAFWQEAIYGSIIIIAVILDKVVKTRLTRTQGA